MFEIIDLTRVLDETLPIYAEGGYSDPPLRIESWCAIREQGYRVARLCMGTQTGTHIDAPAHFDEAGVTLEALPLEALTGPYLWIDPLQAFRAGPKGPGPLHHGEAILFLASSGQGGVSLPQAAFDALLSLPCPVWVAACAVEVPGREIFHFNRALAKAGKYLIEDLDEEAARRVKPGGELIALPLRLAGVSGAPCRVIVRQGPGRAGIS
jgi:kynurenine formamidase